VNQERSSKQQLLTGSLTARKMVFFNIADFGSVLVANWRCCRVKCYTSTETAQK